MNNVCTSGRLGRYTYTLTSKDEGSKIQAKIFLKDQLITRKETITKAAAQVWAEHTIRVLEGFRP